MKIGILGVLFSMVFGFYSLKGYSQIPGHWERSRVCESCTYNSAVFADGMNGVLLTTPYGPRALYVTRNGAKSWEGPFYIEFGPKYLIRPPLNYFPPDLLYSLGDNTVIASENFEKWESSSAQAEVGSDHAAARMLTPSFGYQLGFGELFETHDSGRTWILTSKFQTKETSALGLTPSYGLIEDSLNIWLGVSGEGTFSGSYYRTRDAGQQWEHVLPSGSSAGFAPGPIIKGALAKSYFAVSHTYTREPYVLHSDFYFTTDDGVSWNADSIAPGRVAELANPTEKELWALVSDSIFYSPDYGNTWIKDGTTFSGDTVVGFDWPDSTGGFVTIQENKGLSVYRFVRDPLAVDEPAANSSPSFFPNPFRSQLNLQAADLGVLTLYDMLGRTVLKHRIEGSVIATEALPPGLYQAVFRADAGESFHQTLVKY